MSDVSCCGATHLQEKHVKQHEQSVFQRRDVQAEGAEPLEVSDVFESPRDNVFEGKNLTLGHRGQN